MPPPRYKPTSITCPPWHAPPLHAPSITSPPLPHYMPLRYMPLHYMPPILHAPPYIPDSLSFLRKRAIYIFEKPQLEIKIFK